MTVPGGDLGVDLGSGDIAATVDHDVAVLDGAAIGVELDRWDGDLGDGDLHRAVGLSTVELHDRVLVLAGHDAAVQIALVHEAEERAVGHV